MIYVVTFGEAKSFRRATAGAPGKELKNVPIVLSDDDAKKENLALICWIFYAQRRDKRR